MSERDDQLASEKGLGALHDAQENLRLALLHYKTWKENGDRESLEACRIMCVKSASELFHAGLLEGMFV